MASAVLGGERMGRLIDADALLFVLSNDYFPAKGEFRRAMDIVRFTIQDAPTIDAVPVVHGRWIHPEGYVVTNGFLCSECGNEEVSHRPIYPRPGGAYIADEHGNFFYPPDKKFCHNCGAKMDLEVDGDG